MSVGTLLALTLLGGIIVHMELGLPWMLLLTAIPAGAVLALCWATALRRGRRGRLGLVLRTAAAVLLALSAAGLLLRSGGRPGAVVMLDRSASLGSSLEAARTGALAAGQKLSERFDVSYASFASTVRVETAESLGSITGDNAGTDLQAALRYARENLRAGEPLVVFSDGQFDLAGLHASMMAWGETSPRLILIAAGSRMADAAVVGIDAPANTRPGEKISVIVRVAGAAAGPVGVRLLRRTAGGSERELGTLPAQLPASGRGAASLRFEDIAPDGGTVEYIARIRSKGDAEEANNAARAFVSVLGPIRAGIISRTDSQCAALLASVGIKVSTLKPKSMPTGLEAFDVLVLENMPRSALLTKTGDAKRLAEFVRGGGGLIMVGGPDSYASGGFHDAGELEKVLPASMIPPNDKGLFAVLVLDRSGSMGHAANEGGSKLEMVKKATGAIMGRSAFSERDRLAIVVFDAKPELLGSAVAPTDEKAAGRLRKQLASVAHGGSTDLAAALEKALAVIATQAAREAARHVILLSDGLPVGGGSGRGRQKTQLLKCAARIVAGGGTLSTVGTGSEEQDAKLLAQLARAGRGRFYRPVKLGELAEVFRQDLSNKRARIVAKEFKSVRTQRGLSGLPQTLPALEARNRISAKKLAWVALEAPAPGGRGREPLLVAWERGRGRAACFASGLGSPWNRAALGGEEGSRLSLALVRWAAGRSGRSGCRLELLIDEAGRTRLQLVARSAAGNPLENIAPLARIRGIEEPIALLQESPSRYAVDLDLPAGATELAVGAADAEAGELARAVIPIAYPRELLRVGVNRDRLRELSRLAGGEVVSSPARLGAMEFEAATGRGKYAAAPVLAALALLLVLAELALRATRR